MTEDKLPHGTPSGFVHDMDPIPASKIYYEAEVALARATDKLLVNRYGGVAIDLEKAATLTALLPTSFAKGFLDRWHNDLVSELTFKGLLGVLRE